MSGKVISGPAAVLIVAFFFFPWIMVSCGGMPVGEFSGYHLAAGVPPQGIENFVSAQDMAGEPVLFAVPLAGVVALVLLGITLWKADFEQNAAWGQIVAASAAILILLLEWWQWQQNSDPALEISVQPALWGNFIALLALTAGAALDLFLWYRARPSAPAIPSVHLPKQSFPSRPVSMPSPPPTPETGETAVSDKAPSAPAIPYSSNATIVDDDLFDKPKVSQPTIVEDNFPGLPGTGQPTIVETEMLHFKPDAAAQLIVDNGKDEGKQFALYGDASIGRVADNDIIIDDTAMSSYHARIKEENGRFTILDTNSTNGVYIMRTGQTRWEKRDRYELSDGDKIKLGRAILRFST